MPTSLEDARITVMGLGRFGGGLGVTRFLVAQGARVLVTDKLPSEQLGPQLEALAPERATGLLTFRLGRHEETDFTSADVVVANPAVPTPWADPFLAAASRAGVRVTTEIGLLIERLPPGMRVVAITGSAGKSTTAALTHHILNQVLVGEPVRYGDGTVEAPGAKAFVGGNLGGSLLGDVGAMRGGDVLVLELSSAMLWWLAGARELGAGGSPVAFHPDVGVVTSFAPNHLDWHGAEAQYRGAKQHLLDVLGLEALAVLGPGATDWPTPAGVARLEFDEQRRLEPVPGLRLPGSHNVRNARMALAAVERVAPGVARREAERAAAGFAGLPHRLCLVHEMAMAEDPSRPVRFYDDSKSTVPEATVLAVRALRPGRVHLIAGGYDKKIDLAPIAGLAGELAGLYTIGVTGGAITSAARAQAINLARGPRIEACGTLEAAMAVLARDLRPGDAVLLSPGCASWDQFENFEHRGREFVRLARSLSREPASIV